MTQIGNYSLRPVTECDRVLVTLWIAEDPDHRDRVEPDFFLKTESGKETYAVEDAQGFVVFYIKMTYLAMVHALRLDVQFGPVRTIADRERNGEAMREGFEWLRTGAQGAGFREILFDSTNEPLVAFAKRRLGFCGASGELSYHVVPITPQTFQEKSMQPQQQYLQKGQQA